MENKGLASPPLGAGLPMNEADKSSSPAVGIPDAIADLRANAKALVEWFDSVAEQRKSWGYPCGVEADARDALEAAYRLASSVRWGLEKAADALDAIAGRCDGEAAWRKPDSGYREIVAQGIEAGTAETGTGSVHESPVTEGHAPQTPEENPHD